MLLLLLVLLLAHQGYSQGPTTWTELEWGASTKTVDFDPTTTLVEYRFTAGQRHYANYFQVRSDIYAGEKYVGFTQAYYKYKNARITDNWLRISLSDVGSCKDSTVLRGELAHTVSWDMTSRSVGIVNGTVAADFSSCDYYPEWAALLGSGAVDRVRQYFYASYKYSILAEYRLQPKGQ